MTFKRIIFTAAGLAIPGLALAGNGGLDELIGDLPDGKAIIFCHSVTISPTTSSMTITSRGTVSGTNFASVQTEDVPGGGPTVTDVLLNEPPTVSNLARNLNEDQFATFTTTSFDAGFSDPDAGDQLEIMRITSLPTTGTLYPDNGITPILSVPFDIPRANLGSFLYIPRPHFSGSASFGWTASDGTIFAATPASYTFNIAEQNDNPVAGLTVVDRFAGSSLKIPFASILASASDPFDSPPDLPITIVGATPGPGSSANVSLAGGVVLYDPNGETGSDSFRVTLRDQRGGESQASVNVNIFDDEAQSLNLKVEVDPGTGDVNIQGAGIPGRTYRVQAADTGIPNWFDLPGGAVVADAQGRFSYTDPGPLPPTRIYRTVHP